MPRSTHDELISLLADTPDAWRALAKKDIGRLRNSLHLAVQALVATAVATSVEDDGSLSVSASLLGICAKMDDDEKDEIGQALQRHIDLAKMCIAMKEAWKQEGTAEKDIGSEQQVQWLMNNQATFAKLSTSLKACEEASKRVKCGDKMEALRAESDHYANGASELASKACHNRLALAQQQLLDLGEGGAEGTAWRAQLTKKSQWKGHHEVVREGLQR